MDILSDEAVLLFLPSFSKGHLFHERIAPLGSGPQSKSILMNSIFLCKTAVNMRFVSQYNIISGKEARVVY